MKLVLAKAYLVGITNKTAKLDGSDEVVKVHDIKLTADLDAAVLEELKEGLTPRNFDKHGIPHDPEIGMRQWEPQYENATMKVGELSFGKVRVRGISYIAKPGSIVGIELTARVLQDEDKSGRLTQLVKEERKVTFEKMTQAEIVTNDSEEDEEDGHPGWPSRRRRQGQGRLAEDHAAPAQPRRSHAPLTPKDMTMKVTGREEVTFELEGGYVTVPSETIAAMWLARLRRGEVAPLIATQPATSAPKIGTVLSDGGIFMGVVRLDDGTERGVIDLGEAPNSMKWEDAKKWAEEKGGQLPPRRAQALMFANRADGQFKEAWYWSGEPSAGTVDYAWIQLFGNGGQSSGHKVSEYGVRAVRMVDPSVIR